MKPHTKHVLIAAGIGIGVYFVIEIYNAYKAGITGIQNLLMAPFNSLSNAVSSATATVQNVAAGNAAAATITAQNNSDYAPGGSIYNTIAATQGQAAADAAWQTVQSHQQVQASQTVTLNPLSWI